MVQKRGCAFFILFVLLGTRSHVQGLDIKDYLGDKLLTPRRIVEEMLAYFQQDDPRGIPILKIPEDIKIPGPLETTRMTLQDLSISGHSAISLAYVDVNLQKLQAQVKLNIPRLQILGLYEWPGWFSTSAGELNVTFVNLDVGAILDFGVNNIGIIEVIDMEVIFEQELFIPAMTGLNAEHSTLVYAADTFFDSLILPLVQTRVKTKGMAAINKRLVERLKDRRYPVDISPVDYQIAKVRSDIVRKRNLDPLKIPNKEINKLALSIVLENIELRGLSSIHRSDIIRTEFVDNRFYVTIEIGTQRLKASTDWSVSTSVFPLGSGHADIIIDSLRISVEAQQEADVRHPPILRRIDIELGNLALRSKGERNIDYILEAAVNLAPNILRNVLMDRRVEGTLKKVIQERFNAINLEHIIYDRLNKMSQQS